MELDTQGRLESVLERRVQASQPLAGGMISRVVLVEMAKGEPVVAKISDGGHDLTIEAYMLSYLRENSELPVPQVLHAEPDLLLMEYIAGKSEWDRDSLSHLGRLLAACHQVEGGAYGLERDTLIGPLHQPNPWTDSWIAFFRDSRLLFMTGIARESGNLPSELERRLLQMADALDRLLIEPQKPVLIHGDMWRTNVLVRDGRVAGIIDPALYYAHNEMELAYMTLFDGVGDEFFRAYHELNPIDEMFYSVRRHIYNLYPLLVHLIIFGEKYRQPLQDSLGRFGF